MPHLILWIQAVGGGAGISSYVYNARHVPADNIYPGGD